MAGFCEQGNELSGPINIGKYLSVAQQLLALQECCYISSERIHFAQITLMVQLTGFCEHGNETSGSINVGKYL